MLPARGRGRRKAAHHRTAIDAKLMEKTGLDEVTLRRVRKALMLHFYRLPWGSRSRLLEGGTYPRFSLLNRILQDALPTHLWHLWLKYLEHSEEDIAQMGSGEYPISPYLIRIYSALFGIKIDFLLIGQPPTAEPRGVPIDLWPMTGTVR